MRRTLILLLMAVCLCSAESPKPQIERVVVYKKQRKMVLLSQGRELRIYRVALGASPVGPKQRRGDNRTPEGTYILDARNDHSQYYKAYHVSYPNAQDLAHSKSLGVEPGGDIMLHGLPNGERWVGQSHRLRDWTEGCIAVTDEEMDEIWALVPVGTPIEIRP